VAQAVGDVRGQCRNAVGPGARTPSRA
jgi:hypothetical protein